MVEEKSTEFGCWAKVLQLLRLKSQKVGRVCHVFSCKWWFRQKPFFVEFEEKFIDKFWYMDRETTKPCNVTEASRIQIILLLLKLQLNKSYFHNAAGRISSFVGIIIK